MSGGIAPTSLRELVLNRLGTMDAEAAQEYFGVSRSTIGNWVAGKTDPTLAAAQKVWDETLACDAQEVWADVDRNTPIKLLMPMMESLEPLTFFTLVRACKQYGFDKIAVMPKWRTLIVEARNDLAEKALLTPSEWFIYGDADCVLPCGSTAVLHKYKCMLPPRAAVRNAIERIMSHPKDKLIVGALYKDRRGGDMPQAEPAFRSPTEKARLLEFFKGNGAEGLEEVGWVGFGLVRIHRSVFERMKEAAKPGGLMPEIAPPQGREKDPYGFFDTNRSQRGEDVVFCRRAQKLGIKVWLDTGLLMGHIGKTCYA